MHGARVYVYARKCMCVCVCVCVCAVPYVWMCCVCMEELGAGGCHCDMTINRERTKIFNAGDQPEANQTALVNHTISRVRASSRPLYYFMHSILRSLGAN